MSDLKLGDVVRLKSGGPNMTIIGKLDLYGYSSQPEVKCGWFEGSGGKKLEETFPPETLEIVEVSRSTTKVSLI
ncbi:hypothetical protein D3C72_1401890 [compost metagenome]